MGVARNASFAWAAAAGALTAREEAVFALPVAGTDMLPWRCSPRPRSDGRRGGCRAAARPGTPKRLDRPRSGSAACALDGVRITVIRRRVPLRLDRDGLARGGGRVGLLSEAEEEHRPGVRTGAVGAVAAASAS